MAFGIAAFTDVFGIRLLPSSSALLRALGFYSIGLSTRSDSTVLANRSDVLSQLLLTFIIRHMDLDGSYSSRSALATLPYGLPCGPWRVYKYPRSPGLASGISL